MKNSLQIIVLTAAVCLMSGCTSFYSKSPQTMNQNGAPVSQSAAAAPAAPNAVIPDMPMLEPVETVPGTAPAAPPTHTVSSPVPSANAENPFANGGTIPSLTEPNPNAVAAADANNEPVIKVVRLPRVDSAPAPTSEIQQVGYEEPELAPLPSSPDALNVTSRETAPRDNWSGANNNVTPETQPAAPVTQPAAPNELTMTPTVLDVDKNPGENENAAPSDVSLPRTMQGSEPMDSGVYLEELPGLEPDVSQNPSPSQPTGGNSSQDIPDEVFDLPETPSVPSDNAAQENNPTANNPTSNVNNEPSELEVALDSASPIQQCAAVAPIEETFQIKSLTFVTSIRKLGDFTAVEQPYEFSPGQTLLLYMEFDNPNGIKNLRSGFEVKDSQGKQIASQDNSSSVPEEEKTFFQYVKLVLPAEIAPGEYTIRVWGQPEGEQNVSASTLTFKVK